MEMQFLKKTFFETQSIFDDNIFLQYDDTELCWRLKN